MRPDGALRLLSELSYWRVRVPRPTCASLPSCRCREYEKTTSPGQRHLDRLLCTAAPLFSPQKLPPKSSRPHEAFPLSTHNDSHGRGLSLQRVLGAYGDRERREWHVPAATLLGMHGAFLDVWHATLRYCLQNGWPAEPRICQPTYPSGIHRSPSPPGCSTATVRALAEFRSQSKAITRSYVCTPYGVSSMYIHTVHSTPPTPKEVGRQPSYRNMAVMATFYSLARGKPDCQHASRRPGAVLA